MKTDSFNTSDKHYDRGSRSTLKSYLTWAGEGCGWCKEGFWRKWWLSGRLKGEQQWPKERGLEGRRKALQKAKHMSSCRGEIGKGTFKELKEVKCKSVRGLRKQSKRAWKCIERSEAGERLT